MSSLNSHAGLELFSDLPDDIVVHIISCYLASPNLTNKQAIQLGLLSKAIFRQVQKRPALMFGESDDQLLSVLEKRSKQEITYMYETLVRYQDQNIHLEAFTLQFRDYDPYFDDTARDCIHLAITKGLKILKLRNLNEKRYCLPYFLGEVESLVELSLEGWIFHPITKITWPSLKQLCLDSSAILMKVIGSCPLIENLKILSFDLVNDPHYTVSNLRNLKQLTMMGLNYAFELSAAPKLESITLSCDKSYGNRPRNLKLMFWHEAPNSPLIPAPTLQMIPKTNYDQKKPIVKIPIKNLGMHEYQNVRTLSLGNFHCEEMDELFFNRFARWFPRLQVLSINGNEGLQRISLSNPSLEKIRLEDVRTLKTAHFDVPNIVQFEFEWSYKNSLDGETHVLPELSFVGNPDGWISSITLRSHPHLALKLREKVEEITTYLNRKNSKVSLRFMYS